MLPLRMYRPRLVGTRPTLRRRGRHFDSSKATQSPTGRFAPARNIAIGSVACITTASIVSWLELWPLNLARTDPVPHLERAPTDQLSFPPGPSKDDVTRILSQRAYSFAVKNVPGVATYHGAQVASNSPCEDRFTHGEFPSPEGDGAKWMAWGVFDGHAGWQTAALLEKNLVSSVQNQLCLVWRAASSGFIAAEVVQRAIMRGFVSLDDAIMKSASATAQSKEPLQDKIMKLATGHAGSCALLSLYDPSTSVLHVACTGDSRAVLGRQGPDGNWTAVALSEDQTGKNEQEIARLKAEHPGEEGIVKNGRVLGIAVSRAFGDGRWKWPLELQQDLKGRFNGNAALTDRFPIQTLPYLTAEPVVTSTKIEADAPTFLIMATDGLWDNVSSEQAVELVGEWLEKSKSPGTRNGNAEPTYESFDFGELDKGVNEQFMRQRTTVQDDNAAVHLMRNSLGGNHHELVAARLAFGPPASRDVRDDITVQVVFFDSKSRR